MKLKKILISLFAVLTCIFGITVKADTTAPSSFTVGPSHSIETEMYLSENFAGGIFVHKQKNTNGNFIYCIDMHKHNVTSGNEIYNLKKELDAKYAYILQNGYPKYLFGNEDKDYFTTALAMWYLSNPHDSLFNDFNLSAGTYKGTKSDIVVKMNELIIGANKYSYIDPTISIENSNNKLSLSNDGKYFISEAIGIKTTGDIKDKTYSLSLNNSPSGTIITDINGNEKYTFSINEKFIVKVPTSSVNNTSISFNVKASAQGIINKAYKYEPTNSIYQSVAALYPENKNINTSMDLKLNIITEVQISKIDATTGEELPGAHLVVKDANDKIMDEWISTKEVHIIKGLQPGKYTLTETIAPDGYILSTETITFEIKNDGTVTKVVMKNYLEDKPAPITISKQDITTGEELPGAHLELKDETGEVVYAWVSDSVPFIIKDGLKPGKYTLTETIAPDGYELSTETVEFIVKENGTVDGDIIMYNKPETVEVPSTSSFKTITASLIGIIIIGLGSLIIYRNYKKNEEN